MLEKCGANAPVDFLSKMPWGHRLAVDKRNVTSDLVYAIRREGVFGFERFYQYVISYHMLTTTPVH